MHAGPPVSPRSIIGPCLLPHTQAGECLRRVAFRRKILPVSHVSLPVSHVSLPFRSFFFFLIGVQTKNTIRKELRFVVWWFTARTLPCNDIPEPKRRNISAKRELRLPFRMGTLSVSQRYRSNPPFRRVVTPGWKKIDLFCRSAALLVGEMTRSMRRIDQGDQALRLVNFSCAGVLWEKSYAAKYLQDG